MHKYFTYLRGTIFALSILIFTQGTALANGMSAILYDYNTGQILYEKNADEIHYPASLTKMMTLYLTFQALANEQIGSYSQFPVSYIASIQEPSKLGLLPGQYVTVQDLVLGVATNSANDAAIVLAEGLAGNIHAFSNMMNNVAQQLGMSHSYFENPNGLPNPNQTTSARDMLTLGIALYRDFPQYYSVFQTRRFNYRGRQYRNHNHLLYTYSGVDGIKTGYIRAEGYNLVGSATRDDRRLIAVVLGCKTSGIRDRFMAELFTRGFEGNTNFDDLPTAGASAITYKSEKKAAKRHHKVKEHVHASTKHKTKTKHAVKKSGHRGKKRHKPKSLYRSFVPSSPTLLPKGEGRLVETSRLSQREKGEDRS